MNSTSSFTARLTPQDLGESGWFEMLDDAPPLPTLHQNIDTDYLVIGAGFAGLNATQRLLEHDSNANIVLLEAQRVAWGACGRNSGFMIDLPHELQSADYNSKNNAHKEIEGNRLAIERSRQAAERYGIKHAFALCGKYHGAANNAGLKALGSFSQQLTVLNEPYQKLNATQMQRVTGSDFYRGGLFTPGCAMIQPAEFIRRFAYGLNQEYASLRLFENSPAVSIEPSSPNIVRTPHGQVRAQRIILTVNGHLASFGWFRKQLMHVYTYSSLSEALTMQQIEKLGGQATWGLVSAHPMGTTVRKIIEPKTQRHRIVIRNTFSYNPSMKTSSKQVARYGRRHEHAFKLRFGHLGNIPMQYRWGGHLCFARNSTSVFGEVEKNIFAACCHNGLGTTKGTLNGMLIADLASGKPNRFIDKELLTTQPSKLPPSPLMKLAANVYLGLSQWRTGNNT